VLAGKLPVMNCKILLEQIFTALKLLLWKLIHLVRETPRLSWMVLPLLSPSSVPQEVNGKPVGNASAGCAHMHRQEYNPKT